MGRGLVTASSFSRESIERLRLENLAARQGPRISPESTKPARVPRGMNAWERQRAQELEARKRAGDIDGWEFEGIRVKLADGTWYKPDFLVWKGRDVYLEEIKGRMREAARVRLNVAARLYPMFRFMLLRRHRGETGWHVTEVQG